ncbi:DUF3703 domain-containing protein [Flavobacterium sp. TH16-21]|uniref:DUF3703 domain-containing protein n=2 Tax=Flavobacterium lacisediminis TaxID=2989705 RepID=A0ABT3EIE9_9FLAO|nr:DUF3703 domain-containing protein [Flavobacterium lacisediminis]MCW1148357.1 DUF3703 domain-containing protein [Flavobacterium lacisediminis]
MNFTIKMPNKLIPFYQKELEIFKDNLQQDNLQNAWCHLERAHIIAQKYPCEHTSVHWKMLQFGIKIKSSKEVIGQIPRLLVGGVKSFVGHIPLGNTGGANVPPLKTMEIPEDIQEILKLNA